MGFLHDTIKIKLSTLGYLPDYSPELISLEEMCNAFLKYPELSDTDTQLQRDAKWAEFQDSQETMLFKDYYPLVNSNLEAEYRALVEAIAQALQDFLASDDDDPRLPIWVYTYMLLNVIGPESSKEDIHDMLVLMGIDNADDAFTAEASSTCYNISRNWLQKLTSMHRPPTMFAEPHVIKSLRLSSLNLQLV